LKAAAVAQWPAKTKKVFEVLDLVKKATDKLVAEVGELAAAEAKQDAAVAGEKTADARLTLAKSLLADGKVDKVRPRLEQIIKDFPSTKAAVEARRILDGLK
jgi:hypothetical protein